MSTGAPLNLTLAPSGFVNWDSEMNANLTAINALLLSQGNAIAALQTAGHTVGPTGPVGMVYAGTWSAVVNYVINNVVSFNGGSYIAIAGNTNQEPDLYTNTWNPLSLPGSEGPAGPTGPQGAQGSGGGSNVTFPIPVAEGGTGATSSVGALAALGAAASGPNSDITKLLNLVADPTLGPTGAINISSTGGTGQALLFTDNNGHTGGIRTDGSAFFSSLQMTGGIIAGGGLFSGLLQVGAIGNAVPGTPLTVSVSGGGGVALEVAGGLQVDGPTPTVGSGKVGFGSSTASTANAGGGQATPSTVLSYLLVNLGGTMGKVAVYAV
jgi:hypothetical protein